MLKKITLLFLWVSVSTFGQCFDGFQIGSYHVVSIKSDGTLWGWGESDAGSLGNTNSINSSSFQIGSSTDWLKVSAGPYNTFIIKNNGTVGNPVYVPTLMTGLCATLSTDEFQQENVFTMYPNPAKDVVTLQYDLAVNNAEVTIFDVTGRLIQNVVLNSVIGSSELNVSSYPAGVYLVLIKQGAAVVSSSKLVVE